MSTSTTATPTTAALQTRTAPPRSHAPSRPTATKPEAENSALRFLIYLRLHWLTILFCGSLLGCGLAYAAWSLMPPKYESYALYQVASSPPSISGTTDQTRGKADFVTYMKTTASYFKSEKVYTSALRDDRLTDLPTIQAEKDPYKFLDEKLVVESKEGSEFIRLSIQGENPDDVQKIVKGVGSAYLRQVMGAEAQMKTHIRDQLRDAKASLETLMKSKTVARADQPLAGVPGIAVPLPKAIPEEPAAPPAVAAAADPEQVKRAMFPILVQQVARLGLELPGYDIKISENKAKLDAARKALQQMLDAPVSREAIDFAKKEPDYLKANAEAVKARKDHQFRANVVNDPNSPGIKALERKAEQAEIDAKKILDEKAKGYEVAKREPKFAELTKAFDEANNAVVRMNEQKKNDLAQLALAKQQLSATNMPSNDPRTNPARKEPVALTEPSVVDYITHEHFYDRVTAQLIAAEYDAKLQTRVQEYQPASTPMQRDTKKQIIGTVFAGLMGFALVGAFVVGYESRARRVSSLGEMKAACATPVVAVVPWVPGAATARDPIKRADVSEAIDKLRAYFAQTWLNRGATTVTVTSALGDEGKSFAAFGLASSLAQAGYKTLLVDFDLRAPSLHGYAGVANDLGVCELLRGEADFRKTIQTLPNGLHFLAAGKWSDEARLAAVGGRLDALLLRLKEPFDCLVLHGHALLTAAESVEVARRSEVVLLCAQYRESRIPLLKRAAERIASMEIPYSGIVYVGASTQEALC